MTFRTNPPERAGVGGGKGYSTMPVGSRSKRTPLPAKGAAVDYSQRYSTQPVGPRGEVNQRRNKLTDSMGSGGSIKKKGSPFRNEDEDDDAETRKKMIRKRLAALKAKKKGKKEYGTT